MSLLSSKLLRAEIDRDYPCILDIINNKDDLLLHAKEFESSNAFHKRIKLKLDRDMQACLSKTLSDKSSRENLAQKLNIASTKAKPIVALTTISSRITNIDRVIQSLKNQTLTPASINLYISLEKYLLDDGIDPRHPKIKSLKESGVNVFYCKNLGPYRKFYPLLLQLQQLNADPNTVFITVDDDTIYPENLIQDLYCNIRKHRCVIAHRGRNMVVNKSQTIDNYANFTIPLNLPSISSLGQGKNGIAYQFSFFSNIQDLGYGFFIIPKADDIWAKWCTTLQGISTKILEPKAAFDENIDFKEIDPENQKSLFHAFNKHEVNGNDCAIMLAESYNTFFHSFTLADFI